MASSHEQIPASLVPNLPEAIWEWSSLHEQIPASEECSPRHTAQYVGLRMFYVNYEVNKEICTTCVQEWGKHAGNKCTLCTVT
jgi:hypothetical protein